MPRKSCSGTRVTVLALSTSSPALSIALFDGRKVLARHHQLIGRGHAEALVPAIAALLTGRRAEAIIVDIGPGSYTGIRIGMKPAGGIRTAKDALKYLVMVNETLGDAWMSPDWFRFGASSLLNDVLMQIEFQRSGRYQDPDDFTLD